MVHIGTFQARIDETILHSTNFKISRLAYLIDLTLIRHDYYILVAEFCFRKIHLPDASEPGTTTCRGLFEKQLFSSSRACCENKDGKAYARELVS